MDLDQAEIFFPAGSSPLPDPQPEIQLGGEKEEER
jgi:hypothetical protein